MEPNDARESDPRLGGGLAAQTTASTLERPETAAPMTRSRWPLWVVILVIAALALRVVSLLNALNQGFVWEDPDGYLRQARLLARQGWVFRAFMYGPLVKAPLYPLFLAAIALVSHRLELWAALAQIALSAGAVASLYVIGRELHSRRAGAIAAAIYALWLPTLSGTYLFLQEQLHIPLVVAGLALLVRAGARSAAPAGFAVAGAVLGLAALARSMPLYYIGPAALLFVGLSADRRTAARQAFALVLGLVIAVLPWCLYATLRTGQVILIDNMGSASLGMTYRETRPVLHHAPPPTVVESLGMLWIAVSRAPLTFLDDRVADFQRLFRLTGGQWLELHPPLASRTRALVVDGLANASDALLALSAILSPLGVALARRRREAMLVGLWFALHLALLVAFAWNGVRYRAPYEPAMIVLASVVLAGGWARPKIPLLALALICSIAIGAGVVGSWPGAAARKAPYGFHKWTEGPGGYRTEIVGQGGLSLLTEGGFVKVKLATADPSAAGRSSLVKIFFDGRSADQITLGAGEQQLKYAWESQAVYLELQATFETGEPAPLLVEVARPLVGGWNR